LRCDASDPKWAYRPHAVANAYLEVGDLKMTAITCIAGAVLGLIVAAVANWLVLPMVLQSQERRFLDSTIRLPFPALLGDARRLRTLTIAVYRYVMPLTFASVGAVGAYYLFIADTP
jgi:tetrahydromethanopterin S-methyltransferase subunit C